MKFARNSPLLVLILLTPVLMPKPAAGYSVLSHEAIIDTVWDDRIKPLLLKRFSGSTPDDLIKAHAYAYGGCILQDMGYYPFGSKFFSDLVHYVRSGDFPVILLRDAQDLNEYAFALGALAHYAADNKGHPVAVNRAVPILFPKLRRKFGNVVTYEDDPAAHLKTEFGFDVVQVAAGHYAPQTYHDFIGFEVSKPLLERAFQDTYGLQLKDVFKSLDLALGTYRHSVSKLIPEMTKAAWAAKKNEIVKAMPGTTRRKFVYNLSHASYEKEWDRQYERPGAGARLIAFVFRIIPKIGPFRALAFKPPTAETEKFFMESFNRTLDTYRNLLTQASGEHLQLPNVNFDTGEPARFGDYRMADATYAKLVDTLKEKNVTPSLELKASTDAFYAKRSATPSQ